jgi:hypothetical protein
MDIDQEHTEFISDKGSKKCVHNVAARGAISLPAEHRELVDVLLNRSTVDGKHEQDVPSEPVQLEIDKSDLDIIFKLMAESKLKADSASAEKARKQKRNTEWIQVLEKYISKVNGTCVFMYKDHHFSMSKSTRTPNKKQFLLSADAKCNFSECTCSFHAIVYDNGELNIKFDGHICHSPSEQRARPIRGPNRALIVEKLKNGSTADQLRLEQLGKLTEENLTFGNLNGVGSSPSVFRKIRSEATTSLMLDPSLSVSLEKIKEKQAIEINPGKSVPGYLQTITVSPLRLVLFTEGALVLWHKVGAHVPVSWDATGGIVVNRGKRIFYYELTVGNISTPSITTNNLSGPSFPVTSMLSNTHKTLDLVQWLQDFEKAYRNYYGFKVQFPKPPIVHSDGALVFQLAALRFFNNDLTMSDYLKRCWTIVNKTAKTDDLKKTLVHSCLAHFVKSLKHQALKHYSKKKASIKSFILNI